MKIGPTLEKEKEKEKKHHHKHKNRPEEKKHSHHHSKKHLHRDKKEDVVENAAADPIKTQLEIAREDSRGQLKQSMESYSPIVSLKPYVTSEDTLPSSVWTSFAKLFTPLAKLHQKPAHNMRKLIERLNKQQLAQEEKKTKVTLV